MGGFYGRYAAGSLLLEERWYLLIKLYPTLQQPASYELWANCAIWVCVIVSLCVVVRARVCVCACVRTRGPEYMYG